MKNSLSALGKTIITMIILFLCSSVFFLFLYRHDNKYTLGATQAASGLLVLSEEDITTHPLRFLINGWSYYPNQLLTPEDLENDDGSLYMTFRSIGEQSTFGTSKNSIYGSSTYFMRIYLPKEKHMYALSIPEVFSAYRLYINGSLAMEMGNPDPAHYKDQIQSCIIPFEASDTVSIMLSVSNFSHFYSGMIYPPSFGLAQTLEYWRLIRLLISFCIAMLCLFTFVLTLYSYVCLKQKNALTYALICLATSFCCSYYSWHVIFKLSEFPWYAIEISSGVFITYLILKIHNQYCGINKKLNRVSCTIAFIVFVISFLYGIFSNLLMPSYFFLYSSLIFTYKLCIAVYLLYTAFTSTYSSKNTVMLLFADIVYATSLLWEQFLSFYEPYIGVRIAEWGNLALVLGIGITLCSELLKSYSHSLIIQEEHYQSKKQLAMQIDYSNQIRQKNEDSRRLLHDFRHHLRTLHELADAGDLSSLKDYLSQIDGWFESSVPKLKHFCNRTTIDALLSYYYFKAIQSDITISLQLSLPDSFPVSDIDFCSILGNLLENAIEACNRLEHGERHILLKQKTTDSTLYFLVENTYNGIYQKKGLVFRSLKTSKERTGIGLESVRSILHSYNGTLDIMPGEKLFRIGIILPMQNMKK